MSSNGNASGSAPEDIAPGQHTPISISSSLPVVMELDAGDDGREAQQVANLQSALDELQRIQASATQPGDPWFRRPDPWSSSAAGSGNTSSSATQSGGGTRVKRAHEGSDSAPPTPDPTVTVSQLNNGLQNMADRILASTTEKLNQTMVAFNTDFSESITSIARETQQAMDRLVQQQRATDAEVARAHS
eukprot:10626086-Karenia_brevis.AAC.1